MEGEANATKLTPILPGDLILLEILSRLPVKSLVKFRCVQKSWHNLVKDPRFIKLHFNNYTKAENDSFLLIGNKSFCRTESELSVIRPGSSKRKKLGIRKPGELAIVGSSNGLVCFTFLGPRLGFEFMVMNPALREQRHVYDTWDHLHEYHNRIYRNFCWCFGFGFDNKNEDFKIFRVERIVLPDGRPCPAEVHLYSLRSKTWKIIETPQNILFSVSHNSMVTLGRCMYCVSYVRNGGNYKSITGFDLSSETFHTIPPPETRNLDIKQIVAWKNESLAVILHNRQHGDYELWIVSPGKIPINKHSWKMKTSFRLDGLPITIIPWLSEEDFPIFCRHMNSYSLMYLYKKKESANLEFAKFVSSCMNICCYRETLVSCL